MKDLILCLCDVSGILAAPWVKLGYRAVLIDPQHPEGVTQEGNVIRVGRVIDHPEAWDVIRWARQYTAFVAGFPVCTDLAVSGSVRFAEKRERDVNFQAKAMQLVHECRVIGELSGAPWWFENPVSVISSIYRQPDHTFHPNEYGGYLPEDDTHPLYPDYFPPRDAYGKKTCLWSGGGFRMPEKRPVPLAEDQTDGQGQSKAHNKLGGKSDRTKNIRSATPRGFAEALALEHADL